MNPDTPERALAEAEEWLAAAQRSRPAAAESEGAASVCAAQSIHGIIRANDALTLRFLGKKCTRHDDAPALFRQLVKSGKLQAADEGLDAVVFRAVLHKSGADYGKERFTARQASELFEDATRFIWAVRRYVRE